MSQIKVAYKDESFHFYKVAKQANGSVWYEQGNAVLIATVVADNEPVEDDFLPLTVQYIEKAYAAGKIPGGFIKRESKPSDFETLTSRIIDRSIRPLFPKGFNYPVTVTVLVVSSDSSVDMQLASVHAANAAILSSNLPITKSIASTRVALIDGEILLNPNLQLQQKSTLDLFVTGSRDEIMMIEMRSIGSKESINAIPENYLIELVQKASENILKLSLEYEKEFLKIKKDPIEFKLSHLEGDERFENMLLERYADDIKEAILHMAKSERSFALKELAQKIKDELTEQDVKFGDDTIEATLVTLKTKIMRSMILQEGKRADGRGVDEVRPISIETNILPSVHGSCLFTRGQTQALATVTLGDKKDAQSYELITEKNSQSENFMVHYNFPGFSVGDAKPIVPTNRRELGHGNLAKRALECSLDIGVNDTIRVVSEILESNGSSSMATVCAGSLALVAANVEVKSLIAGVAMGLIKDGDRYEVLTDITGLEDFEGDMDFKVAGFGDGITALQLDIKLDGISLEVIEDSILKAKKAKDHILSLMQTAKDSIKPSTALPKSISFEIPTNKIGDVIGKAGSTIREIIEKFGVTVDINKETGLVKVNGLDDLEEAKAYILNIVNAANEPMVYELGIVYSGKIKKIMDFGMFIEMPDGFDALLHISKVEKSRVETLSEYVVGSMIDVVVTQQNGRKIELATPAYLE